MKDDTSTPITEGSSPNAFEDDKPGTKARSRAEGAIEDLRQRGGVFVDAVRATRMPMALTDPNLPGNPIVFANPSFLKLSGYRMDEVLGQQPHFMDGPDTDPNDAARFAEAIRSDHDDIIETIQYRKDGSRFIATVLISAFKDEDGRTLNHFMSWLDVTRRVEAEDENFELRATQSALRERDIRQQLLIDSWAQAVWETDPDGVVVTDSPSWRAYTGQTLEEWLGYGWLDAIHPDDREYAERQWREAMAAKSLVDAEFRMRASDGTWRWTNFRAAPVLDERGKIEKWAGMNIDIDARKRAESALYESEDRYRRLFESMDEGYLLSEVLFDEKGKPVDILFLDSNPAAVRIAGRDFTGRRMREIDPHYEEYWYDIYGQVASTGEPVRTTHFAEPHGRWFDFNLSKVGRSESRQVASVFRDVTERKRAEDKLRASEERYRSLFESMDEAYAVVDVLKDDEGKWFDFRFVEVNPAFLGHTRMPPPVGKTATELLGTPNPRWTELYGEALDTGKALRVEEGEPSLGLTFDLNIFTLDRKLNRVAVLFTNITERKQAEEALLKSERRANILLAELQHRVRNTLGVIRSIARRTADNTETAEDMLAHFQGRLDAFSRVQAALTRSRDAKVDLATLIGDELVAHAAADGEQVSMSGPDVTLRAREAERLSLAIHELTTNAVKYGALATTDGRIEVRWSSEPKRVGRDLVLSWRESGVEMPAGDALNEGFGMELLRRSLSYDVQGQTRVELRPTGLHFELRMPLEEAVA